MNSETENGLFRLPEHELNYDEFVHYYYRTVKEVLRFSDMARRSGLLALEDEIPDSNWSGLPDHSPRDILCNGLRLVCDGTDAATVRDYLSILWARETDSLKKRLMEIQAEAVLSIQSGDNQNVLLLNLASMGDIPDNKLDSLVAAYFLRGEIDAWRMVSEIKHELPEKREEIRFMERALNLVRIVQQEGLLALEQEIDTAGFEQRDVFEYGLSMIVDQYDNAIIEDILQILAAAEHRFWQKKMNKVKAAALFSIAWGDNRYILAEKMLVYFDDYVYKTAWKTLFGE